MDMRYLKAKDVVRIWAAHTPHLPLRTRYVKDASWFQEATFSIPLLQGAQQSSHLSPLCPRILAALRAFFPFLSMRAAASGLWLLPLFFPWRIFTSLAFLTSCTQLLPFNSPNTSCPQCSLPACDTSGRACPAWWPCGGSAPKTCWGHSPFWGQESLLQHVGGHLCTHIYSTRKWELSTLRATGPWSHW